QLISISRPAGSARSLRRGSVHSSTASGAVRNRHGWVLWTDGARVAAVTRNPACPASTPACVAVVLGALLLPSLLRGGAPAARTGVGALGGLPGGPKTRRTGYGPVPGSHPGARSKRISRSGTPSR